MLYQHLLGWLAARRSLALGQATTLVFSGMASRILIVFTVLTVGCNRADVPPAQSAAASSVGVFVDAESTERVVLHALELPASEEARGWRLSFVDGSASGSFEFVMRVPARAGSTSPVAFTQGSLRRVAGVKGQALVQAIGRAFRADSAPEMAERVDSLSIDVGVLGTRLAHHTGKKSVYAGEFTADEPGDWLVTKLFLAAGEVEVFLAIDTHSGEAQLIAKDPEYANGVFKEFARIL